MKQAPSSAWPESKKKLARRSLIALAFIALAAFGSFWGVWGASVPRVQDQASVSDGALGIALLCVGAGALPSMLLVGRAVDCWGLKVAAGAVSLLGLAGAALVLTTVSLPSLCIGLATVGACSGAADVAMNAVAGRAEAIAGRPVITPAHGIFSALVVLAGLGAGGTAAVSWNRPSISKNFKVRAEPSLVGPDLSATRSQSPCTRVQRATMSSGDHSCRTPHPSHLVHPRGSTSRWRWGNGTT